MSFEKVSLENENLKVTFLDYGARIYEIFVKDVDGISENVLLSLDEDFIKQDTAQFGASVGRVAGRLSRLDYDFATLEDNTAHGINIHSGYDGWWNKTWAHKKGSNWIEFSLKDIYSGYKGQLDTKIRYELEDNKLIMTNFAKTDTDTFYNPTNHSYFNLSGDVKEKIDGHELQILADKFVETDKLNIPTGELRGVEGTPFDFSEPTLIKDSLEKLPNGIDDCLVIDKSIGNHTPTLILKDPNSRRTLSITTDRGAFVIFSTTGFDADFTLNGGKKMSSQLGIAIEPQELPDAPNHEGFGNIVLKANTESVHKTIYEFGIY
ncbi:hypothetical protein BG261_04420 [Floricoccus tropicus]|uniref:Aldose 1-epimerase n=1 Tax=Floricoccus tropicus TaxID=1859473 RepID=A0A1E8GNB4_9LACT|nr:aldose epimerase family protein [Floricoccus tropicus]OFI49123.1 hypothetical protein BG261_04420 [Floricoccus tropicus]